MPKSRLRGGKKAHRKRVNARNQSITSQQNRFRKIFQKELMDELEKEKKRIEESKTQVVEVDEAIEKEGV